MVAMIVDCIILIPFLILAITFSLGKGASFIAGYNMMSDEEKDQYDEVALCKFMGKVTYGICLSIFLWGLSDFLDSQILFIIGMILFLSFVIFALVYMNTFNRFKKRND